MSNKHDIYPPIEDSKTDIKRQLVTIFINIFVLIAVAVIYYLVFSNLFDTPSEHRMRQKTAMLKQEYNELNDRLAEIETILDNVAERDRNVFQILFESEPYDLEKEPNKWSVLAGLRNKNNNELNDILLSGIDELEYKLRKTDALYSNISSTIESSGNRINNTPAIQPIINKELTLLTASFGMRIHPLYKMLIQHNGADFTVPEGTRVFATADGRVKETIRRPSSTGITVVIDHGSGYETYYSHLSNVLVNKGQRVSRGDIIALTGNTGLSLIPHLHYEIRHYGVAVDPVHYFFMELSPYDYQRMMRISRSGMQAFD